MLATPPLVGEQYKRFCSTPFWVSSKNGPYEGHIKPPVELVVVTFVYRYTGLSVNPYTYEPVYQ